MDTQKMIAEIKSVCKTIEAERKDLIAQIQAIDDKLAAYHSAIDSLESIVRSGEPEEPAPKQQSDAEKVEKVGRLTVLTFNGKSQTVAKWAKELHMTPEGIQYRLNHGWSVDDTLSKAKISYKQPPKPQKVFAYDSHDNVIRQYVGIGDAARDLNMPVSTVEKIIAKMTRDDQLRVRNYYLAYVA